MPCCCASMSPEPAARWPSLPASVRRRSLGRRCGWRLAALCRSDRAVGIGWPRCRLVAYLSTRARDFLAPPCHTGCEHYAERGADEQTNETNKGEHHGGRAFLAQPFTGRRAPQNDVHREPRNEHGDKPEDGTHDQSPLLAHIAILADGSNPYLTAQSAPCRASRRRSRVTCRFGRAGLAAAETGTFLACLCSGGTIAKPRIDALEGYLG